MHRANKIEAPNSLTNVVLNRFSRPFLCHRSTGGKWWMDHSDTRRWEHTREKNEMNRETPNQTPCWSIHDHKQPRPGPLILGNSWTLSSFASLRWTTIKCVAKSEMNHQWHTRVCKGHLWNLAKHFEKNAKKRKRIAYQEDNEFKEILKSQITFIAKNGEKNYAKTLFKNIKFSSLIKTFRFILNKRKFICLSM